MTTMTDPLQNEFHGAMINLYHAAAELGYRPTYFLRMANEHGGLGAAKRLLNADESQEGLTKLWELGRLDISVEAHVLEERWETLFSYEEKQKARERLKAYRYNPR